MSFDKIYEHCITKKGATESFPFNEATLVFKVGEKMFALVDIHSDPTRVNLKCNPEYAIELREAYAQIIPGYHMNKKHWNSVLIEGDIPFSLVKELINHSYELVFKSLPKSKQKEINEAS